MHLKNFQDFYIHDKNLQSASNDNIKNVKLMKENKKSFYMFFIFLFLALLFLSSSALNFTNELFPFIFQSLFMISLIASSFIILNMSISVNNVLHVFKLFFNSKSILKKASEEKKEIKKLENIKDKYLEIILNEYTLALIYRDKDSLNSEQLDLFYKVYEMLPDEDLETEIEKRLSISNTNIITNI